MSETIGPRVSVLLPTLNVSEHIGEAIDSLLIQTFGDFELIVIDDGSDDGTVDIVRSFDDSRIRLVERTAADGLAGALNAGLNAARGEFVARQDGDDVSAPDRLARQVGYLDTNPEAVLVGTAARMITESGNERGVRHVLERSDRDDLLEKNRFVHGSVMFRAEPVREDAGGYDELFTTSEDYDLWLRLAEDYALRNLDAPLYTLRLRQGSTFAADLHPTKLFGRYAARRAIEGPDWELEARIRTEGASAIYETLSETERGAFHAEIAQELLRYGRRKPAFEQTVDALRSTPTNAMAAGFGGLALAPTRLTNAVIRLYRTKLNQEIVARNTVPPSPGTSPSPGVRWESESVPVSVSEQTD